MHMPSTTSGQTTLNVDRNHVSNRDGGNSGRKEVYKMAKSFFRPTKLLYTDKPIILIQQHEKFLASILALRASKSPLICCQKYIYFNKNIFVNAIFLILLHQPVQQLAIFFYRVALNVMKSEIQFGRTIDKKI